MSRIHTYFIVTFLVVIAACNTDTNKQPISLHPANNHYFLFRDKPTVLITSGEHYGSVLNLDFDYSTYLNTLQADGLNYTRIFTGAYVEDPGAFNIANNTLAPKENKFISPWGRSSTPGYDNGGNKFDLNTWNADYFKRLKDFISEAGKRGIVVEVTLFSSFYGGPDGSEGWKSSPLHPKNNVNGTDSMAYTAVQTLNNGNLLPFQEQMVRKIISELKDFDNIIYEIQNEPWADNGVKVLDLERNDTTLMDWQRRVELAKPASLDWQKRIASFITDEEASYPNKHLIAQNIGNFTFDLQDVDAAVSVFNFHYALPEVVTANYDLDKVIGFDESGFSGNKDVTYRRQAWRFILAGGGLFNNLDYSFTTNKPNGTESQEAPGGGSPVLRKQLKVLKDFMYSFDFTALQPIPDVVQNRQTARVFVLADPGKAYAIYLDSENQSELTISLPAGNYTAEWVNTQSGEVEKKDTFEHVGGNRTLPVPAYTEDFALRIKG